MESYYNVLKECSEEYNKIFLCDEKTKFEIEIDEENYEKQRNELLQVNFYMRYSRHTYDNKFKSYSIYRITSRCIDQNNNLILFFDQMNCIDK